MLWKRSEIACVRCEFCLCEMRLFYVSSVKGREIFLCRQLAGGSSERSVPAPRIPRCLTWFKWQRVAVPYTLPQSLNGTFSRAHIPFLCTQQQKPAGPSHIPSAGPSPPTFKADRCQDECFGPQRKPFTQLKEEMCCDTCFQNQSGWWRPAIPTDIQIENPINIVNGSSCSFSAPIESDNLQTELRPPFQRNCSYFGFGLISSMEPPLAVSGFDPGRRPIACQAPNYSSQSFFPFADTLISITTVLKM